MPAIRTKCHAVENMRLSRIRRQFEDLVRAFEHFLVLIEILENIRQVDPQSRIVGSDFGRMPQEYFGIGVVVIVGSNPRQHPRRLDVIRITLEDAAINILCPVRVVWPS